MSVRRAAILDTAAMWSASRACCIPSKNPNPRVANIAGLARLKMLELHIGLKFAQPDSEPHLCLTS